MRRPVNGEATRFARADGGRVVGGSRMLSLRLTPEEWAQVDQEVVRSGRQRSDVVRQALAAGLSGRAVGTADPDLLTDLLVAFTVLRTTPGDHGAAVDSVAEAYRVLSGAP